MDAFIPQAADRDVLIERHHSFVRALAANIAKSLPPHADVEELVACGNLGLVEAAERYDPRRSVSFSTFAYYRIRGAIYDCIRKLNFFSAAGGTRLRFSEGADELLSTAVADEYGGRGLKASDVEDEIVAAQAIVRDLIPIYLLSLDEPQVQALAEGGGSFAEELERADVAAFTRSLVGRLADDDRLIIEEIYLKNISLTELAARLGITKSWASRLHARAIARLRELLQQHGVLGAPPEPRRP